MWSVRLISICASYMSDADAHSELKKWKAKAFWFSSPHACTEKWTILSVHFSTKTYKLLPSTYSTSSSTIYIYTYTHKYIIFQCFGKFLLEDVTNKLRRKARLLRINLLVICTIKQKIKATTKQKLAQTCNRLWTSKQTRWSTQKLCSI